VKNVWNVLGVHLSGGKIGLCLAVLGTIVSALFSTAGIANAQGVSSPGNRIVIAQAAGSSTCAKTIGIHQPCATTSVHPFGTNGQQMALWIGSSLGFESVLLSGTNQNGTPTAVCAVGPNGTPIPADQWHYYGGYWWVGTLSLSYYTGAGCTGTDAYNTSTNVPGYQAFSDYWCFSVRTSLDPTPSSC